MRRVSTYKSKRTSPRAAARRARERDERRRAIRTAGTQVFAARGFERATMDEVAAACELGKATLYYYYPNKQALLTDILVAAAAKVEALVGIRRPTGEPSTDLRRLVESVLAYLGANADEAALFLPLMARGEAAVIATLGARAAQPIAALHAPLRRALRPVQSRFTHGAALPALLASLLPGLVEKARLGGTAAVGAELALLVELLSVPDTTKRTKRR